MQLKNEQDLFSASRKPGMGQGDGKEGPLPPLLAWPEAQTQFKMNVKTLSRSFHSNILSSPFHLIDLKTRQVKSENQVLVVLNNSISLVVNQCLDTFN